MENEARSSPLLSNISGENSLGLLVSSNLPHSPSDQAEKKSFCEPLRPTGYIGATQPGLQIDEPLSFCVHGSSSFRWASPEIAIVFLWMAEVSPCHPSFFEHKTEKPSRHIVPERLFDRYIQLRLRNAALPHDS